MPDREKVIAWLTEISLRPCDFTRDDFDAYETEHLANEALEICEDAKVFNKQRNDALALLKEQEEVVRCKDCVKRSDEHKTELNGELYRYCELHRRWTTDDWFCADGERRRYDE